MKCSQIISSCDRPAQLDLLLRSCRDMWPECTEIFVLYKATTEDFRKGYERVFEKIAQTNIALISENDYKVDLLGLLQACKNDYVLTNSDDNVFINPVDFSPGFFLGDLDAAFSLRLGRGLNRCEPAKRAMHEPIYRNETAKFIKWDWSQGDRGVCYYYPQPYDSNIYRRGWLIDLIKDGDWHNPYSLEVFMNQNRDTTKPFMVAFKKSCLISVMYNTTNQNANPNMRGCGMSCEELNRKWLDGYRIKTNGLYGLKTKQCHIFYQYEFEKDC